MNVELLKLSDNRLTGEIPSILGSLSRLTELQMGGNLFSGAIPVELGQLYSLQISLNISHNRLSGTIPNDLGKLQLLESLYLNDNQLVGDVPASFSELISLLVCNLSNNNLVGPVPNNPAFLRMDSTNFAGYNGSCKSGSYRCHPLIPFSTSNKKGIKESSSRAKLVAIILELSGYFLCFS